MAGELIARLNQAGLRPTHVTVDGRTTELRWTPDTANPVVDNRTILVLPDLHLGDGGDADIFRGPSGTGSLHRDRFEKFLTAAKGAKADLAALGKRLSVVQLGDCYDVWRAFPFHENVPGRTYQAIRGAYGEIESLLVDDLDARFCVGNHDALLAKYPPDWAFTAGARLAYSQRFCKGSVFAFHGHQGDDFVDDQAGQNGQVWVALGSALSSIVNPAGMALQELIDRREDAYPGDLDGGWPEGDAPLLPTPFSATRWSNYGGRPRRFQRMMEAVAPALSQAVRIVVVGHTHRPGIAWFTLGTRVVPVIDVGSWTYGRSQFCVIDEGRAVLWEL